MNARRYPSPDEHNGHTGYVLLVVLKRMHGGLMRAYAGIVRDTSREDRQYQERAAPCIMAYGNPVPFEEARMHFSGISRERYYEG